jgi:hypothetical protein
LHFQQQTKSQPITEYSILHRKFENDFSVFNHLAAGLINLSRFGFRKRLYGEETDALSGARKKVILYKMEKYS